MTPIFERPIRAQLETQFTEAGIDFSRPGFYDHPEFKARTAANPAYLLSYADYILSLDFTQDYLDRARKVIQEQATFLYAKLVEDGRMGACIDLSLTLSRFLERDRIWNYPVTGATSLVFDESTGLPRRSFETILTQSNPAKCGHVWMYAPPFVVLDMTIKRQTYFDNAPDFIPSPIFAESFQPSSPEIWELVERPRLDEFISEFGREPTLDDFPDITASIAKYGCHEVHAPKVTLKYLCTGIMPEDGQIEDATDLCLSGKARPELYTEYQNQRMQPAV